MATIEQNAADWRGNFVSLVIVGLFLGTISFLLQPPEFIGRWQETASSAAQTPVTINIPWANWTLPSALTTSSNVFSFSISTLLLLLVVIQLARYWAKFFLSESPNRIVLFACTEALALLEANGLETRPAFTMPEKRFLARQLGFDFHSRTGITPLLYIDDNGRGWYLESLIPSPSRKWANSLIQWVWQRLNIRQVVSEEEE